MSCVRRYAHPTATAAAFITSRANRIGINSGIPFAAPTLRVYGVDTRDRYVQSPVDSTDGASTQLYM
jgi:hypothetical protein